MWRLIKLFIYLLTLYVLTYLFIYLLTYLFTYLFIYLVTYLVTRLALYLYHLFSVYLCRCGGRNWCVVRSNYDQFGDPCPGTSKYLQVTYECIGMLTKQRAPTLP